MRWLFLMMLTLNLAYLGWETSRQGATLHEDIQPLENIQPIVLLSELRLEQQVPVVAAEKITELQKFDETKPQLLTAVEVMEATETVATRKVAESIEIVELSSVKKPEENKKAVLMPDKEQNNISVLVTSQNANKVEAEIKPLEIADELAEEMVQKNRCFTLGYFRDLEKLQGLAQQIKPYVLTSNIRDSKEQELSLHWVYIPPQKNRKAAIATGKRLQENKIKDFYVIREGEKIHGVSLGYFRNKNSAYGLAEKAKKFGFDVIVEAIYKSYTAYWLDYQLASGADIPESILGKHSRSAKKGKANHLSRDCDD